MNGGTYNEPIYLATVKNGTDEDIDTVHRALQDAGIHGVIVVGDEDLSLAEIPALDAFADELADRVAKRVSEVSE